MRGLSLNLHKKRSRVIELPLTDLEWAGNSLAVEDRNLEQIEYETLNQALENLPPIHRDVLYLMYYEGLSVKEISKSLRLSESTAKKRLERARQALQKVLLEEGWNQ